MKAEQEFVKNQSAWKYQYLMWKANWWNREVEISDFKIADYKDSQ